MGIVIFWKKNPKKEALNDNDCSLLWGSIITSGKRSVFQLYSSLLDCDD
jgi:hypothetical protein